MKPDSGEAAIQAIYVSRILFPFSSMASSCLAPGFMGGSGLVGFNGLVKIQTPDAIRGAYRVLKRSEPWSSREPICCVNV